MSELQFLRNPQYLSVMKLIEQVCQHHGVDQSHGLSHAVEIALHVQRALNVLNNEQKPSEEEQENVILASLLHDIDDHKYFKTESNKNASEILERVEMSKERKAKILRMIDLVSFSKNGNTIYPTDPIYFYFTRYSDRIEALGLIGLYRTLLYAQRTGTPFFTQQTAKPNSREEISNIIQGRDKQYMQKGGKSLSVIDHMFDKILHIRLPEQIKNTYLEQLYAEGIQYIVHFVLEHATNGYVNAEKDLLERVEKWNQQKKTNDEVYELIK